MSTNSAKPVTISKTLSGLKFMQRAAEQKKLIEQDEQGKDKEKNADDEGKPSSAPAEAPSSSHGPQASKCRIVYERAPGGSGIGRFSIGQKKEKKEEEGGRGEGGGQEPRPGTSREKKRGDKGEAAAAEVSDAEMAALAFQRGPKRQKP